MKRLFKKGNAHRRLLDEHYAVVLLHGHHPGAQDAWEEVAFESLGQPTAAVDVYHWLHIGAHSFSPYSPTFLGLHHVRSGEECGSKFEELQV